MVDISPLVRLQATEHEEILNGIDQLRAEGVSQEIGLPQLIVCGDQSSGKSSVLEAISGLSFPARDNACTRFATELILRRSPVSKVTISIFPDQDRSAAEKARLESFSISVTSLAQFGEIVSNAGKHIGVENSGYSKDILRVEVSSPDQPDLTLVDLPGLYHAADETQDEEGADFVESLVESHMKNPRSVILAVISAKSDIALQKITKLARRVDPRGERTMGIITKPDELSRGSEMERSFLSLAMNQRAYCGLGWHVLKNRSYDERKVSLEERHRLESEFLSSRIWTSLPVSQRGIDSLRPRLSEILQRHIIAELPSLLAETQKLLMSTQNSLNRLGMPRQSLASQRHYLLSLSDQFTQLINDAVNGTYIHVFFGDSLDDTDYKKRLRAVIQNRLQSFKDSLLEDGQARRILDDDVEILTEEISTDTPYLRRKDYLGEVKLRIRRSRGRELPGTFNPLIIGDLFHAQSTPWETITFQHFDFMLQDVQSCISLILEETVDENSRDKLIKHIFTAAFDVLEENFRSKTKELLKPHKQGHPITYNSYLVEKVEQARLAQADRSLTKKVTTFLGVKDMKTLSVTKDWRFQISALVEALKKSTELDMEMHACSEAADYMQAYYEIAMARFVDDFSDLAVEQCLMQPLLTLFRSDTVALLSDQVVEEIAKEDETLHNERLRLTAKSEKLQKALIQFHHLERYQSAALRPTKDTKAEDSPSSDGIPETPPAVHGSSISQDGEIPPPEPVDEPTSVDFDWANVKPKQEPITEEIVSVIRYHSPLSDKKKKKHKQASFFE